MSKLTHADVVLIRRRATTAPLSQIAADYDVSYETIRQVVDRITWRHVPDDAGDRHPAV